MFTSRTKRRRSDINTTCMFIINTNTAGTRRKIAARWEQNRVCSHGPLGLNRNPTVSFNTFTIYNIFATNTISRRFPKFLEIGDWLIFTYLWLPLVTLYYSNLGTEILVMATQKFMFLCLGLNKKTNLFFCCPLQTAWATLIISSISADANALHQHNN